MAEEESDGHTWERGYTPAVRHDEGQMLRAIVGSGGNVREIARRLGCTRPTVYRWIRQSDLLAEVFDRERRCAAEGMEALPLDPSEPLAEPG